MSFSTNPRYLQYESDDSKLGFLTENITKNMLIVYSTENMTAR